MIYFNHLCVDSVSTMIRNLDLTFHKEFVRNADTCLFLHLENCDSVDIDFTYFEKKYYSVQFVVSVLSFVDESDVFSSAVNWIFFYF